MGLFYDPDLSSTSEFTRDDERNKREYEPNIYKLDFCQKAYIMLKVARKNKRNLCLRNKSEHGGRHKKIQILRDRTEDILLAFGGPVYVGGCGGF